MIRLSPQRSWKLKVQDGSILEYIDITRSVGNRIIRAYLLEPILEGNRIERVKGSLRDPKDRFKDFAKFLVLRFDFRGEETEILAEAAVYENLRIVGTNSDKIKEMDSETIVKTFTEALQDPEGFSARLMLSEDSRVSS